VTGEDRPFEVSQAAYGVVSIDAQETQKKNFRRKMKID